METFEEFEAFQEKLLDNIISFFENSKSMKKIMCIANEISKNSQERKRPYYCFEPCIYPYLYEYLKKVNKTYTIFINERDDEISEEISDFIIKGEGIEIILEFKIIERYAFSWCKNDFDKIKQSANRIKNNLRKAFFEVVVAYPCNKSKNNFFDEYEYIKSKILNKIGLDFALKRYKKLKNNFRIYIFKYVGKLPYIKDVVLKGLNYDISKYNVFIFGSRAKGNAKIYSDWDIALEDKEGKNIDFSIISKIWNELDEMLISADIVDLANVSKEFKENIKERILITEGKWMEKDQNITYKIANKITAQIKEKMSR